MLDRVTITGADDQVDPLAMLDLSVAYPWLEWGLLVSRSNEGKPRYPSHLWQKKLLNYAHRMNLSMHVCGKWAQAIFRGDVVWTELPPVREAVQRIQINGECIDSGSVLSLRACNPGTQFIIQWPRNSDYLTTCRMYEINCVPLFDDSGGKGICSRSWYDLPSAEYVGYAGGIGPDNVESGVFEIMAMRSGAFWIDMESRVRDDQDRLDLRKVEKVLDACQIIRDNPQFDDLLRKAEAKMILKELEQRDRQRGIFVKEPPHCEYCFEGCPRCQPV